jgi:hypothetical protein
MASIYTNIIDAHEIRKRLTCAFLADNLLFNMFSETAVFLPDVFAFFFEISHKS